jgi:hypothetical protein
VERAGRTEMCIREGGLSAGLIRIINIAMRAVPLASVRPDAKPSTLTEAASATSSCFRRRGTKGGLSDDKGTGVSSYRRRPEQMEMAPSFGLGEVRTVYEQLDAVRLRTRKVLRPRTAVRSRQFGRVPLGGR